MLRNRRQDLWPPSLRAARTISGVEYVQVLDVCCICCLPNWRVLGPRPPVCLGPRSPCNKECSALSMRTLPMHCAHMALTAGLQFTVQSTHRGHRHMPENTQQGYCVAGMHDKHARSCSTCCTKRFLVPWQQIEQCKDASRYAMSQWLSLQATRARDQIIKELESFFSDNNFDAFLGAPLFLAYDGNLVGLPQVVVPTGFVRLEGTEGPRKDPRTMGIYAAPYQNGEVRLQAIVSCCHCMHCLRLDARYNVSSYGE